MNNLVGEVRGIIARRNQEAQEDAKRREKEARTLYRELFSRLDAPQEGDGELMIDIMGELGITVRDLENDAHVIYRVAELNEQIAQTKERLASVRRRMPKKDVISLDTAELQSKEAAIGIELSEFCGQRSRVLGSASGRV